MSYRNVWANTKKIKATSTFQCTTTIETNTIANHTNSEHHIASTETDVALSQALEDTNATDMAAEATSEDRTDDDIAEQQDHMLANGPDHFP